ncbi:hypothetical protein [Eleftheria terrae]|uniref:hypothetical protein n=1 Tax=Eleftheria terrae TaxID=1597781 RepID=UPI00263BE370|nr:hypothetical protein [Eleftheria terrae]WKB53029.1 hypothetical protein N7L95_01080 [Eleftheria terrae]
MPVPQETPYIEHVGNGVTVTFAYPFTLLRLADLVVKVGGVTQTTGYIVSGSTVGGSVIFNVPPAAGIRVELLREIALERKDDYQENGDFLANTVDMDFDRIWQALQGHLLRLGGALRAPYPEQIQILPAAEARAEHLLMFGEDGEPTATPFTVSQVASAVAASYNGAPSADAISFFQLASGAVVRSIQSKLRETTSALDFGVDTTGATTADAALLSWAAAATSEGVIGPGYYRLVSGNIPIAAGARITIAPGAVFDLSGAPAGTALFSIAGSAGSFVNLTADAAKNATSVSIAAGAEAGFAAGDLVQVVSESVYDAGWSNAKFGEHREVLSVASGVVTFTGPLRGGPYTTAASAKIRKITPVRNVSIDFGGAYLIGSDNPAVGHRPIRLDRVMNCDVRGLRARHCADSAIEIRNSINVRVRDVDVSDCLNASSGYGLNVVGCCEDILLDGGVFRRCRHAATTSTPSGDYGIIRGLTRQNSVSYDTVNSGDAWDTHANVEDLTDINLRSYNSSSAGFNYECSSFQAIGCKSYKSASSGFRVSLGSTVEKSRAKLVSCESDQASIGFDLRPATALNSTESEFAHVTDCVARNASSSGLICGNSTLGATAFTTKGLRISGGHYDGNSASGSIMIQYDTPDVDIEGVLAFVRSVSGSGIQCRCDRPSVSKARVRWLVSGANGTSSSAAVRFTDCSSPFVDGLHVDAPLATSGARAVRATGTTSGVRARGTVAPALATIYDLSAAAGSIVDDDWAGNVTIAAGVVAVPHGGIRMLTVDTEASAATDDLDTINGGVPGQLIAVKTFTSTRDVVLKDGTGNMQLGADITIGDNTDSVTLVWTGTYWLRAGGFSDN